MATSHDDLIAELALVDAEISRVLRAGQSVQFPGAASVQRAQLRELRRHRRDLRYQLIASVVPSPDRTPPRYDSTTEEELPRG